MNEKILRQTNGRTYNGNLHDDAMSLGVGLANLEKVLNRKCKVTFKARKLFRLMISTYPLPTCQWKDMPSDVVSKEKALVGRKTTRLLIKLK